MILNHFWGSVWVSCLKNSGNIKSYLWDLIVSLILCKMEREKKLEFCLFLKLFEFEHREEDVQRLHPSPLGRIAPAKRVRANVSPRMISGPPQEGEEILRMWQGHIPLSNSLSSMLQDTEHIPSKSFLVLEKEWERLCFFFFFFLLIFRYFARDCPLELILGVWHYQIQTLRHWGDYGNLSDRKWEMVKKALTNKNLDQLDLKPISYT